MEVVIDQVTTHGSTLQVVEVKKALADCEHALETLYVPEPTRHLVVI